MSVEIWDPKKNAWSVFAGAKATHVESNRWLIEVNVLQPLITQYDGQRFRINGKLETKRAWGTELHTLVLTLDCLV